MELFQLPEGGRVLTEEEEDAKMKKQERDFRKALREVSETTRVFYRHCLGKIRAAKREKVEAVEISAPSVEAAAGVGRLFSHPRNGYAIKVSGGRSPARGVPGRPSVTVYFNGPPPEMLKVREGLDRKRASAEALRQETERRLADAGSRVRRAYEQCVERINAVPSHPPNAPEPFCTTVIYTSQNSRITRTEITLIHDLLQKQGWDVRLAARLDKKKGPPAEGGSASGGKPVELIYYHHHRSHGSET